MLISALTRKPLRRRKMRRRRTRKAQGTRSLIPGKKVARVTGTTRGGSCKNFSPWFLWLFGVSCDSISLFHLSFFSLYSAFIFVSKVFRSVSWPWDKDTFCTLSTDNSIHLLFFTSLGQTRMAYTCETSLISFFSVLIFIFSLLPSSSWCFSCIFSNSWQR